MYCCSNNHAVIQQTSENNRERSSSRLSNIVNSNILTIEQIRSSRGTERHLRVNEAHINQRHNNKIETTQLKWTDVKGFADEYLQLTDGETKQEAASLADLVGIGAIVADIIPGLLDLATAVPFAGPLAKVVLMFYKVTKQYCKNSKAIKE